MQTQKMLTQKRWPTDTKDTNTDLKNAEISEK